MGSGCRRRGSRRVETPLADGEPLGDREKYPVLAMVVAADDSTDQVGARGVFAASLSGHTGGRVYRELENLTKSFSSKDTNHSTSFPQSPYH